MGTTTTAPRGGAGAVALSSGPIVTVGGCPAAAEVEAAADPSNGYVYVDWIDCKSILFARSTDGGRTFSVPSPLPRPASETYPPWDPAIAVGPGGAVYASFMGIENPTRPGPGGEFDDGVTSPIVDVSRDHGLTWTVASLPAESLPQASLAGRAYFGDRDFVAVGSDGAIHVSWDFAPVSREVRVVCPPGGSCGFSAGDFNIVTQTSADQGSSWSAPAESGSSFPDGGAVGGPLLVEPGGRIDMLYLAHPTDAATHLIGPGREYFTASTDGGATWSAPVQIGTTAGQVETDEWWIDCDIGVDQGGNLYATWDTEIPGPERGWISYSADHGRTWSAPIPVTSGTPAASANIVQVVGGVAGNAYVAWLAATASGYSLYFRPFSIAHGFLTTPYRVTTQLGALARWPGDTIGIALLPPDGALARVALSWGSTYASAAGRSEVYATVATVRA